MKKQINKIHDKISKDKVKNRKELRKKYNKEIPVDIKIVFGKFYIFSIVIILLLLVFTIFLYKYISLASTIAFCFLIPIVYGYIIYDVKKQRGYFQSSYYYLTIALVLLVYILSLLKIWV